MGKIAGFCIQGGGGGGGGGGGDGGNAICTGCAGVVFNMWMIMPATQPSSSINHPSTSELPQMPVAPIMSPRPPSSPINHPSTSELPQLPVAAPPPIMSPRPPSSPINHPSTTELRQMPVTPPPRIMYRINEQEPPYKIKDDPMVRRRSCLRYMNNGRSQMWRYTTSNTCETDNPKNFSVILRNDTNLSNDFSE